MAATAIVVACSTSVSSPSPPSLAVNATTGPSPTPKLTSIPVARVTEPPAPPPPSVPPARTWTAGGVTLDLPVGWSDPPDSELLALIFAFDQLGDRPAGLYTMLNDTGALRTAQFVFRHLVGRPPSAALEARWIPSDGRSLNDIVHQAASSLRSGGIDVTRSRVKLRAGTTPVLAWTQPIRLGSIQIRAYFFELPGGVTRLDVGTLEVPSEEIENELHRILSSVRAAAG